MKSRIEVIKAVEFLRRIAVLISNEETGCLRKFAKKLDLSVLDLKRYLSILNKNKTDIVYSKAKKTFYFKKKSISGFSQKKAEVKEEIIGFNNFNEYITI